MARTTPRTDAAVRRIAALVSSGAIGHQEAGRLGSVMGYLAMVGPAAYSPRELAEREAWLAGVGIALQPILAEAAADRRA